MRGHTAFKIGSRLSLRQRLQGGLNLLLLAVLLIGSLAIGVLDYQLEKRTWMERVEEAAHNASYRIEAILDQEASSLAMLKTLGRDELEEEPWILSEVVRSNQFLLELVYLDPEGKVIAQANRGQPLLSRLGSIQQTAWFRDAGKDGRTYSIQQFPDGADQFVLFLLPAWKDNTVAARMNIRILSEAVSSIRFGKTGSAYLMNRRGDILVSGKSDLAVEELSRLGKPGVGDLLQTAQPARYFDAPGLKGNPVMGMVTPVPGTDWLVVVELSESEGRVSSSSMSLLLLVGSLFLFFCVSQSGGFLLDRLVLRPLQEIRNGAVQIGQGRLDHRIQVCSQDELGQVAAAFNEMAINLSEREEQLNAQADALASEVSVRQEAEAMLQERSEALQCLNEELEYRVQVRTAELNALFAAMNDVVIVYDRQGRYVKIPSTNTCLLYRPPEEMIGKKIQEVLPADLAERLTDQIHRALDTGKTVSIDYSLVLGGREVWFDGAISPMGDDSVVLVAHDITGRKLAEEQLQYEAFHDALTGLPNRALFLDRLGRAIERTNRHPESRCSVLYLDLDRFKVINDSLGHTAGDQLLIGIAKRLETCLRGADTAARLGGDEFVILLEDLQENASAIRVAERLQSELSHPFNLDGYQVVITASIGVVNMGDNYHRPEDVLRDADIALYRAKALGKACYFVFDASLRTRAIARLELESELRAALERGEFGLHYQPIQSLRTNRLTGFEALLRWRSPRWGLLQPEAFIPVAEETGLIVPIGEWVLGEACRQIRTWQDLFPMDPPLSVNVNISGVQFAHPSLARAVASVLAETGLQPGSLKLEITESVFMDSVEGAQAVLAKLRDLGVQLQIDDFGTGYSSLAYLQRFPIHTIKIDQSFIRRLTSPDDPAGNREIVKTIVALARDLGMEAIAEGVETEAQLSCLKTLDCQYGQGFFIAQPLEPAETETLLSGIFIRSPECPPEANLQNHLS